MVRVSVRVRVLDLGILGCVCSSSRNSKSKAEEVAMDHHNHQYQSSAMEPSRNMIDAVELEDNVGLPIDGFPQNKHDQDSDSAFKTRQTPTLAINNF